MWLLLRAACRLQGTDDRGAVVPFLSSVFIPSSAVAAGLSDLRALGQDSQPINSPVPACCGHFLFSLSKFKIKLILTLDS